MRYATFIGVVVSTGVAVGAYTLWRSKGAAPRIETVVERSAPTPTERPRPARPAAPRPAAEAPPPILTPLADTDVPAEDTAHDDGVDHNHEQVDLRSLEVPPTEREAFGADPASDGAALAEARTLLEGLLEDPDPAVRAEVTALLATIETAE